MKPDDELLALWVEDELDVEIHAGVGDWAGGQQEWLEQRELARATKSLLGQVMRADEEVPHGEFFNARIRREITLSEVRTELPSGRRGNRMAWFMPLAAAAGMVLGIWIGRGGAPGGIDEQAAPVAEMAPVLYTPEQGVNAEIVASTEATVILLAGVDAIPDSWGIPETASIEEEGPHTASVGQR